MSYATFYVLNDPAIYEKLVAELTEAIPDPSEIPPLPKLESLPYLKACINEGKSGMISACDTSLIPYHVALRLSFGIAQRLSRISPDKPIEYDGWVIPPGMRFGMSSYMTHRDPRIFPAPEDFVPERWLGDAKSPSGRQLERYIFTFGRGPRVCLGINLAKAEIYIGLATLFRRIKLSLYETTKRDVTIASEYLVAMPVRESRGVRAIIH